MAIQVQGSSGVVWEIGGTVFRAGHVHVKPLEYGSLGHYRTNVKIVMATSQGAGSRLFELRNAHATNFIIPTRSYVEAGPAGTITTGYLGEFSMFKVTGTTIDTTNTVTPVTTVKRSATMAAYPGGAQVRHCTLAGAAAGMTGGTLLEDTQGSASFLVPLFTLAATSQVRGREMLDDVNGTHPYVFVLSEGWVIRNMVVGSATANVVHVVIDQSWAEVTAF